VRDGQTYGVRARACLLACDHALIPRLVPELPPAQKAALATRVRVPMLLTNVFLRNWTAFAKLQVSTIDAPGLYHCITQLEAPISIGSYRCSRRPEDPVVVHMQRSPAFPGMPRREQLRRGADELLATPFEEIERQVRRQLARMLADAGFDPAVDILAITANRWPSGFAYAYDTLSDPDVPDEQRPHVLARRPFGSIAIANVDAGGAQYAQVAIDQAYRAVQDLARISARG
jgi:spermidine dehydrogenase